MAHFSPRPLPGAAWPPLAEAGLAQVWAAYLALGETQWLAPEQLVERQLLQCRALLEHCARHVPYYRELLTTLAITPDSVRSLEDLRRIPLLSRRAWQEQFDRFEAEQLPKGTVALDEDRSSGSTGVPVRVLKTNRFYVWWLALYLRDLEWSGMRPEGTLAAIRATLKTGAELDELLAGLTMSSWNPILEPLIATGPLHGMDIRQEPRRQLAWLEQVNPDYLLSHASNLELLASLLADEPRRFPKLAVIQSISETLSAPARAKIEAAFSAPVKNLYSCTRRAMSRRRVRPVGGCMFTARM